MDHTHTHDHTHDHDHPMHDHNHDAVDPAEAERIHLRNVLTAFTYYKSHALKRNHRRRHDFLALPEHHKRLIPDVMDKINQVDRCIEQNMIMLRDIVKCAGMFMGIDPRALVAEGCRDKVTLFIPRLTIIVFMDLSIHPGQQSTCNSYGHGQGAKHIKAICTRLG